MFRKLLIVGLALLTAACVPIPAEPPTASEPPQKTEQLAECPGGYLDMLPGQSASDPVLSSLPAYIDIVGVDSSLDGETLTAVFYLRGIPEEIAVNREGVENMHLEYMWTVSINLDGDASETFDQTDYTLDASYGARRVSADTPATVRPFRTALRVGVYQHKQYPEKNETHLLEMRSAGAHLHVSHEENTLTLIGRVPGITDESSILFSTFDILLGQDGVSCEPS
ncbi:MAG: hypothetical protein OXO50_13850 [Caldilineaceae bacterium]|nr:hypothetical protein [Caldilineaceae bacterium]MDE0196687.1 hypothetical protein [Caldilineaceae bacterium]